MKRLVTVAVVFAGLGAGTTFANYPVIDVSVLTETIEQVYQQYMSIQQAIQSVQNQYVQIKHAIEAVKNFDMSQFKALGDPEAWQNPETIRNAYKATLTAANRYANQIKNVKNKVARKHIRIGNMKVSAADLLGFGGDNDGADSSDRYNATKSAFQLMRARAAKIRDAYTGQLTWEERKAIMDKYGMSAENYAETQVAEDAVESAIGELVYEARDYRGLVDEEEKAAHDEMLQEIQEGTPESATARADMQNSLLIKTVKGLSNLSDAIEDLNEDIALQDSINRAANNDEKRAKTKKYRNQCKENKEKNYASVKVWI